jgi:hypothetical protein
VDSQRIVRGSLEPLPFALVLATDHRSPATGVVPSLVRISKAGGAFAAPAGAVSERGSGWYQTAGNAGDSDTVGPLALHAEAPGCDPVDCRFEVVPDDATSPLAQGSTAYPMTVLMIDSLDHVTGKPGLSPTVTIAKPGGTFGAPAGAVSEIGGAGNGFGWYRVGPAIAPATDYDVAGPLLLHATAAGADPTDDRYDVAPVPGYGGTTFDLRQAIKAKLAADAALANTIGARIRYGGRPSDEGMPALVYRVVRDELGRTLDGPTGAAVAHVRFDAWSEDVLDCTAINKRINALFNGASGDLFGVRLRWASQVQLEDDPEWKDDGSDDLYKRISVQYRFSYWVPS